MSAVSLPVSGTVALLRAPNGADDVFLSEQRGRGLLVAIRYLARVATNADGTPIDWHALPLTDVDAALLELRRFLLGDVVRTAVRCVAQACGSLFDISFSVSDYLEHHLPRAARVGAANDPGWFRLPRTDAEFRVPTASDVLAVAREADVERSLADRCIRKAPGAALRRRVENAMQALAPSLYDELECVCHECGAPVPLVFDPTSFVLGELARRAANVYEDVHLLAWSYHWSEDAILALPQQRRARYAEMATVERMR